MVELDTLLRPVLDEAPVPKSMVIVRARATARRRRRTRRTIGALVAVSLAGACAIAALAARDDRTEVHVSASSVPVERSLRVGPPTTFSMPAMDVLAAFGSIWVSQPERVARLDLRTGQVVATVSVPGSSDFRPLAAGAGSIWIDDTARSTVTRIDPVHNTVVKTLSLNAKPLGLDGLAFVDGKLWIARPQPEDDTRGDVIAIDPSTYRIVQRVTVPRTFGVVAGGDHWLWYVRQTDLLRLDTRTLRLTTVRRDAISVLTVASGRVWVLATGGVVQVDPATGRQIGRPIASPGPVNVTAAAGADVVWLAAQPDSSSPGSVAPYDIATGRRLASTTPLGLPILTMTVLPDALWVASDGLTRIPFVR